MVYRGILGRFSRGLSLRPSVSSVSELLSRGLGLPRQSAVTDSLGTDNF
jgi:hypothetical protein